MNRDEIKLGARVRRITNGITGVITTEMRPMQSVTVSGLGTPKSERTEEIEHYVGVVWDLWAEYANDIETNGRYDSASTRVDLLEVIGQLSLEEILTHQHVLVRRIAGDERITKGCRVEFTPIDGDPQGKLWLGIVISDTFLSDGHPSMHVMWDRWAEEKPHNRQPPSVYKSRLRLLGRCSEEELLTHSSPFVRGLANG